MTERQLLQYYMALEYDADKYCKHSHWDGYFFDCPYREEQRCMTCPYWDLDINKAIIDAKEDIMTY